MARRERWFRRRCAHLPEGRASKKKRSLRTMAPQGALTFESLFAAAPGGSALSRIRIRDDCPLPLAEAPTGGSAPVASIDRASGSESSAPFRWRLRRCVCSRRFMFLACCVFAVPIGVAIADAFLAPRHEMLAPPPSPPPPPPPRLPALPASTRGRILSAKTQFSSHQ